VSAQPFALPLVARVARAAFGAIVLVVAAACSSPAEAPIARGATVVVLGDSLTAGYGLSAAQSWVAHLGSATGWKTVNGGVSGDTSAQGMARLPALLEEHRPAAVFIALGGNDFLQKLPVIELRANLLAIAGQVRRAGARPVLVAVPAPSVAGAVFRNLADHEVYAALARDAGMPLLDEAISEVLSRPEWKLDALHPNAEGHRELAERMVKKLRTLGFVR
jgi:acyl-CoA hydrolase